MLGMIPGNGHPYSWSAIVNGYNADAMRCCPYPVIQEYLSREPAGSVGIEDARVTHVWTDNPAEAASVAQAARIPNVVTRPEDVIGQVDAVLVAVDDGDDHVWRVHPFVEAGIPVFVDKPLATNFADLSRFDAWARQGARLTSSSGLRYAPEIAEAGSDTAREALGELRWITSVTCKTWERYGIHALEAVEPLLGPGFLDVSLRAQDDRQIATLTHRSRVPVTLSILGDAYGSFGTVNLFGTKTSRTIRLADTYRAFRGQLLAFIDYVRTGRPPVPYEETRELMLVLLAGIRSRESGGIPVPVSAMADELAETETPQVPASR